MITTAIRRIALAGNPNTGKTTLFNRLTGLRAKVGNYPGVTVERLEGQLELGHGLQAVLLDVPGTYSLSSRSAEETIALQAIAGLPPHGIPDLVLVVVDATQLSRNLYLVLQILETGLPAVCALNMSDSLRESGRELDAEAIERELGIPCVAISARTGEGIDALKAALQRALEAPEQARATPRWIPSGALDLDVRAVAARLPFEWHRGESVRRDALALWALLSLDEEDELVDIPTDLRAAVNERRSAAASAGREIDAEIIGGRYAWIDAREPTFVHKQEKTRTSLTDRIDAVLLSPVFGFALFLLAMGVVFQTLFTWADPAIGLIESAFGWLQDAVVRILPPSLLTDFVRGGLIEGVGSVLVFLPQILLLFFFLGVMEDSGYMARIAYLMDRIMKSLGLHGRAFVPMLSGFACAIPAILATRTMERRRDRLLTMMVVPLMTCSARLPVYTLLIGALFPPSRVFGVLPVQGLLMVGMYLFSVVVALLSAAILGRTLLRGPRVPLLIEMPPYRMPHWASVWRLMLQRSRVFVSEAGSVILACTVCMWILLSFPRRAELTAQYESLRREANAAHLAPEQLAQEIERIDDLERGERLRKSYGGQLGALIEPAIAPLGFDWKIGIGLIGAFAAREVFVSTMGVVYGLGDSVDESTPGLRERIRAESHADGRPVYTPLAGLSLMVFFALACQCMSTLAVVRRETRTWRWPTFLFLYNGALAWLASFIVYQGGKLFI